MKKRVLSLALALVMVCGLLPVTASAATVTQVVPYKYNAVYDFSEGLAVVRNDNGWGVIDTTGKEVIPCGTLDCNLTGDGFHDGCLSLGKEEIRGESGEYLLVTWSFVDVTGKTIFPNAITLTYSINRPYYELEQIKFDQKIRFHEGLAAVEVGDDIWDYGSKFGFIDTTGKEVVPCKYDNVGGFSEGLAAVELDDKYGFIDKTGKEVVPPKYDRVGDFSEGLAAVKLNGKWGFIDKTGREVIPCQYSSAEDFENGRAVVTGSTGQIANGHTVYAEGVIDKSGNVVVPFGQYKASDDEYHDGLKAVWKNGKLGFVDQAGNQIIPAKYDSPRSEYSYSYTPSFTNGLAAVYLSDKGYGYIDLHGNEVIPFQYGSPRQLSEGMLAVDLDGRWGFVRVEGLPTTPGAPIIEPEKPTTTPKPTVPETSEDFYISKSGDLYAYLGSGGHVVIPDGVTSISDGFVGSETVTSVTIPDSVTQIRDAAFSNCKNLTSVTFGNGLTSLGSATFSGCTSLTNVTIPSKVTTLESYVFQNCTSLTSMTIPDSVTTMEYGAFIGCTGLTNVTIGSGLTDIAGSAFQNCDSLTGVVIPGNITSIGKKSFFDCDSLASVTIPASVTSIGDHAFTGCNKLTDVYYGGSQAQWNAIALDTSKNEPLARATIHYNSAMPAQPAAPTAPTAYASTQVVQVDGKPVTFNAYALKDANGNDTNYIKLRDVADVLNGSAAQFQVGWDGTIAITTGQMYTPNGSENIQNFTGNQSYTVSTSPVTVNGKTANLEAITLTDASGGGYTYFKLRDLGQALGFNVSWSAQTGIAIDPNTPYNPNN